MTSRAAPTDGEANRSVTGWMADWLGVPPTTVRWERAGTSRAKVVEVDGLTVREVAARLPHSSGEAGSENRPSKAHVPSVRGNVLSTAPRWLAL